MEWQYIACIGLLSLWGILDVSLPNMWHAATYTVNHMQHPQWEIGHLWSLSLEEQFYLIWPLVFLAIGPPKAIWAALALIALGPIARTSGWLYEVLHGSTYHDYKMFPMLSDTLAMGCLLACLKDWLESKPLYLRLFHPAWSLTVLALVLAVNRYSYRAIVSVPGTLFISLGIALLIHRSVYCPSDWIGKLLNNRILSFTGILSYSLYIWQQPFLNRYANYWASAFPQNIIFTIAAALASYFLLEKPLLQMRRRLRS